MKKFYNKFFISSVITVIILAVIIYKVIDIQYENYEKLHTKERIDHFEYEYNYVSEILVERADMLVDLYIRKPEVLETFEKASSENPNDVINARNRLKDEFLPVFNILERYQVRQFQFHLPNYDSFLRLHKPEKYGDNLELIRYSVVHANDERKSFHGYEEGRVYNGFRNVYPLELKGRHLGSVEISYSFNSVLTSLKKEVNGSLSLMIDKNIVEEKVFESLQDLYRESTLSDQYVVEKYYEPDTLTNALITQIKPDIQSKLSGKSSFGIPAIMENQAFSIIFLPVANVEGDHVAYITIFESDPDLFNYYQQSKWQKIWLVIVTVFLSLIMLVLNNYYIRKKEDENKLVASDNLLKKLTEHVPGALYQYQYFPDGSSKFPYASSGLKNIYEVEPEEVKESADKVFKVIHKDDAARVKNTIKESYESLTSWKHEYRVDLLKGGVKWLHGEAKPEKLDDGSVQWHGYIQDITERVISRQKLKASEKKFSKIGEAALDAVILINQKGNVEYWNPAAEKMFGILEEDILGKSVHEFVMPNKYEEQQEKAWNNYLITGEGAAVGKVVELTALRSTGEEFPIEIALASVQVNDQLWSLANIRDITERKNAEQILKEREAHFSTIFELSPQAMALTDLATAQVIEVNQTLCNKLEVSKDEVIGRTTVDLGFYNKDELRIFIRKLLKEGTIENFEMSFTSKSGNKIIANSYARFISINKQRFVLTIYDDITERKKAEAEIKKFKLMSDKAAYGVAIIDETGTIEYLNDYFAEIHGYSKDELIGNGFEVFHSEEQLQKLQKINERVKEAGFTPGLEVQHKHRSGYTFPMLMSLVYIKNDTEEMGYIAATAIDITESVKDQEKLKSQKEQFELAVSGSNDGIWDWDLKTNELYLSPRWKEQLGYADYELDNNFETFQLHLHPVDKNKVMTNLDLYLNGEIKKYDIEFKMLHKDGSYRWMHAKGEAIRDEEGKPSRMAGSHSDITDRKDAEKKLKNTYNRLNSILNSVQAGVILVRKKDRVIVEANPAVEKMLNLKKEDFLGKSCNLHICPAETGGCPVFDHGLELDNSERTIRKSNGELIPILKNASIIELGGEEYLLESFVDISAQKAAEIQLIEAKKTAEAANKSKSEFLANMSHEIRTPMNSILGFSEVMLNTTHDEKQKGYLTTILNSGKTLLSIINDILDLSKIEAGRLEISPMPVDIKIVADEIKQIFEQKVQEKGIELILEVDEKLPSNVTIDEVRLRQILLNITGNAVKFTSNGFVKISLKVIKNVDGILDFNIAIADTGIGILEKDKKRIFESFSQQSNQDTRKFGGTGLGLAISKRLCEMMNGKITLESEQGKGSTFNITFYNVKYSQEQVEHEELYAWDEEKVIFKGSRILIVDDVPYNRDLVHSYLEQYDLMLFEAEDGESAIKSAKEFMPDLVFMDIRMPGINGYEATEKIKADSDTKNIPIIALTASTMQSETERIESLFQGYLRKPIHRKLLINEMIKFLPHETEEAETELEVEKVIEDIEPKKIDEKVKKEFRDNYFEKMDEMIDMMIVDELEQFTETLNEFAESKNLKFLKKYSAELKNHITNFDFDKIADCTNQIKKYFE